MLQRPKASCARNAIRAARVRKWFRYCSKRVLNLCSVRQRGVVRALRLLSETQDGKPIDNAHEEQTRGSCSRLFVPFATPFTPLQKVTKVMDNKAFLEIVVANAEGNDRHARKVVGRWALPKQELVQKDNMIGGSSCSAPGRGKRFSSTSSAARHRANLRYINAVRSGRGSGRGR